MARFTLLLLSRSCLLALGVGTAAVDPGIRRQQCRQYQRQPV